MLKKTLLTLVLCYSFNLHAFELLQVSTLDQDSVGSNSSAQLTRFNAKFPDIELLDHRNQSVVLNELFDDRKNVIFAFFFTHCVSVCTTITLSLKSIQDDLPPDTMIVMISIDPDTDTPDLLSSYATRHRIDDPNWYLLTGVNEQIVDFQKDFEAYRGNKMNHTTSLFVKQSNSDVITEFKSDFSKIPDFLKNS